MQFHVYEVKRKKGSILHLHTPSCKRNESMKKKGASLWKIEAPYVDDAKENFVITSKAVPLVVHTQCCHLFRKPTITNPPCPHCQHLITVLRGKLSPGHYEYACVSCKKTFVVKKEKRVMKIKINRTGRSVATKMSRDERKALRLKKREERKAAREVKQSARKTVRIERIGARMQRAALRLVKLGVDDAVLAALQDAIGTATAAWPTAKTAKTAKAKTSKTVVAKTVAAKKTKKAAPLKTVAYAPKTNQPTVAKKAAAKKTSRKK